MGNEKSKPSEDLCIPSWIHSAMAIIEDRPTEGVYRLSATASRIKMLRESLVEQSYNIKEMDAIAIGALIKSVYRESPLITGKLYKKIMANRMSVDTISQAMTSISGERLCAIRSVFKHLKKVAANSSITKMGARNLAIVWAPNLMRSDAKDAAAMAASIQAETDAVEYLITNFTDIFPDEKEKAERAQEGAPCTSESGALPTVSRQMTTSGGLTSRAASGDWVSTADSLTSIPSLPESRLPGEPGFKPSTPGVVFKPAYRSPGSLLVKPKAILLGVSGFKTFTPGVVFKPAYGSPGSLLAKPKAVLKPGYRESNMLRCGSRTITVSWPTW